MKLKFTSMAGFFGLLCATPSAHASETITGTSATGFQYQVPAQFGGGSYAIRIKTSAPIRARLSLYYDSNWDMYEWPSGEYIEGNDSCCLNYDTAFSDLGTDIKLVFNRLPLYIQYTPRDYIDFGTGPRFVRKYYDYVFSDRSVVFQSDVPVNYTATFAAVPEPATWFMLIIGFGVIGGAMRARRTRDRISVSADNARSVSAALAM